MAGERFEIQVHEHRAGWVLLWTGHDEPEARELLRGYQSGGLDVRLRVFDANGERGTYCQAAPVLSPYMRRHHLEE